MARNGLVALALLVAVHAQAEGPDQPATGRIFGVVIDASTGRPLAQSQLVLMRAEDSADRRETRARSDGTFEFKDLPVGIYLLRADLFGYLQAEYGATSPGRQGTPILISQDTSPPQIVLKLVRGAVVSGTIRDRAGDPTPGITVIALQQRRPSPPVVPMSYAPVERTLTDDRGRFRLANLVAGNYVLLATPRLAARNVPTTESGRLDRLMTNAPVYFPGTPRFDFATVLQVKQGDVQSGLDFAVGPVAAASVSGKIVGLRGRSHEESSIQLMISARDGGFLAVASVVPVAPDGSFELVGLPAGGYDLEARAVDGSWAQASLIVSDSGETVKHIEMPLAEAISFAGVFSPAMYPSRPESINIHLRSLGEPSRFPDVPCVVREGAFRCDALRPGHFRLQIDSSPPWLMTALSIGGMPADFIDVELLSTIESAVVSLDRVGASVVGTLTDSAGLPAPGYFVVLMAVDSEQRSRNGDRQRLLRPASDGSWHADNLPPGEYFLAVVIDAQPSDLNDHEFLDGLVTSRLIKVTLRPLEQTTVPLRIGTTSLPNCLFD